MYFTFYIPGGSCTPQDIAFENLIPTHFACDTTNRLLVCHSQPKGYYTRKLLLHGCFGRKNLQIIVKQPVLFVCGAS